MPGAACRGLLACFNLALDRDASRHGPHLNMVHGQGHIVTEAAASICCARFRPPSFGFRAGSPALLPATMVSKERPWSRLIGTIPLGTRSTVRTAVRRGISVIAAEWPQACHGVHARRRRGPAAIQDIIVRIVKRERAGSWTAACANTGVMNINERMAAALTILGPVRIFCLRVSIGGENREFSPFSALNFRASPRMYAKMQINSLNWVQETKLYLSRSRDRGSQCCAIYQSLLRPP